MSRTRGLAALVVLYIVIGHLIPPPATITPQGWRQTAIFICVIAGMVTDPLPASALVLIGLTAMAANGTPMREVLGGYAEPSVWLVFVAMLIAKVMLDTGLARRIALLFVRAVGKTSLGIAYALQMTDVTLASGVPSITARSAGMVLPIGLSIAEFVRVEGRTSRRGTGSARTWSRRCIRARRSRARCSSPARRATCSAPTSRSSSTGVQVTAPSWFMAAIVPGLLSCLVVPWITFRVLRPERHAHARSADLRPRRAAQDGTAQSQRVDHADGLRRRRPDVADHGVARRGRDAGGADRTHRAAGHRHHVLAGGVERAIGVGCVRVVRRHAADGRAAEQHRLDPRPRRKRRRLVRRHPVDRRAGRDPA